MRKGFEQLQETTDDEEDMLDLAWGLTDTSRLGCQVLLTTDVDGMRIMIPEESSDLR